MSKLSIKRGQHIRRNQRGYILITLMLFVALLAIASLGWIQSIEFQVKRDREEELIHRGVQYSRAIRRYVKKFGRYPSRIEDLQSTNNIRFLRKRYKDPITGKDFRLLHMNDVQISFNPGAASGLPPGAADMNQGGAPGALNTSPLSNTLGGPGPSSIPSNQVSQQPGATDNSDVDVTSASKAQNQQEPGAPSTQVSQTGMGAGPVFGGAPIIGVASTSKNKSIREFNKKDHYNQWQFIYDPSTDRGGLLTTPNQPPIRGAAPVNQQQNGQTNNGPNNTPNQFGPSPTMNSGPQPPPVNPQQPDQH
jgi:type II secretory pathway pseudopilin PulG